MNCWKRLLAVWNWEKRENFYDLRIFREPLPRMIREIIRGKGSLFGNLKELRANSQRGSSFAAISLRVFHGIF